MKNVDTQCWIAGAISLGVEPEQKTAIGELLYNFPALRSFPFIFVPHGSLDKASKVSYKGNVKGKSSLNPWKLQGPSSKSAGKPDIQ